MSAANKIFRVKLNGRMSPLHRVSNCSGQRQARHPVLSFSVLTLDTTHSQMAKLSRTQVFHHKGHCDDKRNY